ncbi:MAG: GntR family transcriptional regulator [Oceanococcus sp.]
MSLKKSLKSRVAAIPQEQILLGAPALSTAGSRKAYMASMQELFSTREMKALQDEAPTPLYFQLFTLLKNRILNGSIPYSEQMPTEEDLAKGFGVSRITAKRALDDLASEELVERRRGKGTFVTYAAARESVHAPLLGELEKLSNLAHQTHVQVLDVGQQIPPGDVAAEMGVERGELVWRATRIRCTEDDIPYGHHISWTVGLTKGYTKRELERRVRLDILKDNGVDIHKIVQTISAVPAQEFFAHALNMDIGEPTLQMVRRIYDSNERLVDILYCHHNPRRFQFRLELDAEEYQSG